MEELKETVKDEFMPWVSQYLVMKRVSIELNFHSLYSNFMDALKNIEFNKMVLAETYRNIKVCKLQGPLIFVSELGASWYPWASGVFVSLGSGRPWARMNNHSCAF